MTATRHLLSVWNPDYAEDPLDQHLHLFLKWVRDWRDGACPEEDVYVWWAKLRSSNRTGPLPHLGDVLALEAQLDGGIETHLYLTDYRSLYVAELTEVTVDEVAQDTPGERDHMPGYYHGRPADCWMKLADVRLLVANDTVAVIQELKALRNVRYHDRPVSLYGGIVDLPLIVTREDGREWFSDRQALTDGLLWAEHGNQLRGETARMEQELRDNCIGPTLWARLASTTRQFLASAEAVFRGHRDDPAFDFTGAAVGYAKAMEVELNSLLFPVLRRQLSRAEPRDRIISWEGARIDLGGRVEHQTLGVLERLLGDDDLMRRQVRTWFGGDAKVLLEQLPSQLGSLVRVRNPASHSAIVSIKLAQEIRSAVLGIGLEGMASQLARVKLRQLGKP